MPVGTILNNNPYLRLRLMGLVSALQVDTGDGDGAWPGGGRGFRAEPIAPVTDRDSPIGVRVIVTMRTEDLPAEERFEWWFEQVS
jgi:hypothetical protein